MNEIDPETRLIALLAFVVLVAIGSIVVVTLLAGLWRRQVLRERLWDAEREREAAKAADMQDTWAAAAQRLKAEAGDDPDVADDNDDDGPRRASDDEDTDEIP